MQVASSVTVKAASATAEGECGIPWSTIQQMDACMADPAKMTVLIRHMGQQELNLHSVAQFLERVFTFELSHYVLAPK